MRNVAKFLELRLSLIEILSAFHISLYASHSLRIWIDPESKTSTWGSWSLISTCLIPLSHNNWHFSWAFLLFLDFMGVSLSPGSPRSRSSILSQGELHSPQPCLGLVLRLFLGWPFYIGPIVLANFDSKSAHSLFSLTICWSSNIAKAFLSRIAIW